MGPVGLARPIAKNCREAYTPPLPCPPSLKVRQREIEAGDSEGRLPQLFSAVSCQLSLVSCKVLSTRTDNEKLDN
jgi:hypothetical protein